MKKQKTEKRKLVELVSKQRGIKTRSAYGFVRRAEIKGSVPKGSGLTKYAAAKLRADIRTAAPKVQPVKPRRRGPVQVQETAEVERKRLRFEGVKLFKGIGLFRLGSGFKDVRQRTVRHAMSADDVNDILNAASYDDAAGIFAEKVGYVTEAIELEGFEFDGKTFGPDFYD